MHDIRYDAVHDEFLVTNPFAKAILTFRGAANGEEPPIRVIQGPSSQMGDVQRVDIDLINNEIVVPSRQGSILVFPREGNGDVAPLRVIRGPDTQLHDVMSVVVDPVHNLLVVGCTIDLSRLDGNENSARAAQEGSLLIFNRTDQGNVKPRAIIRGPKTGILLPEQMQLYAPRGWVLVALSNTYGAVEPRDAFVGIWSINDNGDVPPRWKLSGPKSQMKKPRGVALNPKNKELIVADMSRNAVFTYYFPEIF